MVKVCESCSRVSIDLLKTIVPENNLTVHCIGHCEGHDGKTFGILNDVLVIKDSEAEFIEAVKALF
jgi:hypothetical protein